MALFESLCTTLYANPPITTTLAERQQAQAQKAQADCELKSFTEDVTNFNSIRFFLENSHQKYVQFVAASALKQLIEKHWTHILGPEIVSLKDTLLNYLA